MSTNSAPLRQKLVIDGYNAITGALTVMPHGTEVNDVRIDLGRLADQVAATTDRPAVATDISCHIGVADRDIHPRRHAWEMEQIRQWRRDRRVTVHQRTSHFDRATGRYTEKGVDTAIAVDLLTSQISGRYDSVILFSADRDLEPALAEAYAAYGRRSTSTRVELARWDGQYGLWLHGTNLWCHYLDAEHLSRCSVRRNNRSAA